MIPTTALGFLVFAASVGPGFMYAQIAQQRRPRMGRSGLFEVAELVSIGGFTSAVAVLLGLLAADWTGWVLLDRLAADPTAYVIQHPARSLSFFLATLALSYAFAILVALVANYGRSKSITDAPVWHDILSDEDRTRSVFATVELSDGRLIQGQVANFTVEDTSIEDRHLALAAPLQAKAAAGQWTPLRSNRVLINARDIAVIDTTYVPIPEDLRRGRRRMRKRPSELR